jgi:hypothetical protein
VCTLPERPQRPDGVRYGIDAVVSVGVLVAYVAGPGIEDGQYGVKQLEVNDGVPVEG